jgi:uncharacterized protein (DUF433 family)
MGNRVVSLLEKLGREGIMSSGQAETRASWISKKAGRCGGDACIRDSRIPVWVLVNYRRLGGSDADLLRDYPSLTPADLEAAWKYAAENVEEISHAIRENEEGEEGMGE